MPLTGIEIFKLLPKKNCGECGVPTCLAFAMNLAAGKAELAACPYVSEEAKEKLEEASAPPIRPVTIGVGEQAVKIGGETVLFRHEKRFENPTPIGVLVTDTMEAPVVEERLQRFRELQYERVGLILRPEVVAMKSETNDPAKFSALAGKVKETTPCAPVLMSETPEVLAAGLKIFADQRPLLYAATRANVNEVGSLAQESKCPVAVKGTSLDEVIELTTKLTEMGLKDIVIDSGARTLRKVFEDQVAIRRAALLSKLRPLGFPTITFPCEMATDLNEETLIAATLIAKYAGMVILSDLQGASLFPLLVERMNIFTDPQRPLATTEGIYPINNPDESAPVLITSNFSLTYFIVSGEIENSRVPAWLLVKDTEGLSVMTAWAAGKFVADAIAPFVKNCGITEKIKHRKLVIPGYAAAESGGLEEELPDWEILIGPREASYIPAYLRNWPPAA